MGVAVGRELNGEEEQTSVFLFRFSRLI